MTLLSNVLTLVNHNKSFFEEVKLEFIDLIETIVDFFTDIYDFFIDLIGGDVTNLFLIGGGTLLLMLILLKVINH